MVRVVVVYFVLLAVKGTDSQYEGCYMCWLCDKRPLFTPWFAQEMICMGGCYLYNDLPKNNGSYVDEYCATLEDFERCRGKDNVNLCFCLTSVCTGEASRTTAQFLSVIIGSFLLTANVSTV